MASVPGHDAPGQTPYTLFRLLNGFLAPFRYRHRAERHDLGCIYIEVSDSRLERGGIPVREFPRDPRPQTLERFLPTGRDATVLDCGCGDGSFLLWLKDEGFSDPAGVDLSGEQVEKSQIFRHHPGL